MRTIFLTLLVSFLIISCQKDETPLKKTNEMMVGNWINPVYIDTLVTFEKAATLIENQYGVSFEANNKMVERKNSGWCGTPPIVTNDYTGEWNWNDSLVNIKVGYWGGTAEYTWQIISADDKKLVVTVVKSSFLEGK